MNEEEKCTFIFSKRNCLGFGKRVFFGGWEDGLPIEVEDPKDAKEIVGMNALFRLQDDLFFTRWKAIRTDK